MVARARTDEPQLTTVPTADERAALTELAAMRHDLVQELVRAVQAAVTYMGKTPQQAADDLARPIDPKFKTGEPHHIAWYRLAEEAATDPAQAEATWQTIKDVARDELDTGVRMARTLEAPLKANLPYDRAQFVVILEKLAEAMQPRDGLEELLVEQMASAYEQHLRWTAVATLRAGDDAWQGEADKRRALRQMGAKERERYQEMEGWLPPRLSTAEAIDHAVLLADRYQRAFLRLLKQFRDTRKLIGMVVVGSGGTLNVADQQINVQRDDGE